MNKKLLGKMTFAAAVVLFAGCKDDAEEDIFAPSSSVDGLCVNEVCSSGTDWVELYNGSEETVDLSGYFLQDSKGSEEEYIFPEGTTVAAGGFLVLEKEADFPFGISGDGDEIVLLDAAGAIVDRVTVPALEDGQTYARATDGGGTWEVKDHGTKGASNTSEPVLPEQSDARLLINEVMCNPADGEFDFVEIYNAGDTDVDLGGFILQDEKGESEEYIIPAGTMVGAKSVILFTQAKEGNPDGSFGFGLGKGGDKVVFLDSERRIVDEIALPEEDMPEGTSYSRVGDGGATWEIMAPTGGRSNGVAPSLKGVVVLNEVYTFSGQESVDDLDYIELYNTSSKDVDIAGYRMWEGGGQEEAWTFPAGSVVPANGFLVVKCDKEGLRGDAVKYPSWGLSKNDEVVVLADADYNVIDQVETPNMSEGEAYGRKTDGADEWVIFAELTEGKSNDGAKEKEKAENTLGVYVNEVFTNNQDARTADWDDTKDFIELYNATDSDIDLGGCSLLDDKMDEEDRYTFPEGTIIRAKGFLTFDVEKKNANGPAIGLGTGGDKVLQYNQDTVLVDEMVTPEFGDTEIYTVGRKTDGGEEIVVFTEVSKNASNNGKATK